MWTWLYGNGWQIAPDYLFAIWIAFPVGFLPEQVCCFPGIYVAQTGTSF